MKREVIFLGQNNLCGDTKRRLVQEVEKQIKTTTRLFLMGAHGSFDDMALSQPTMFLCGKVFFP